MIDWDRVTELREEVGEEDFHDVVDIFMDEVDSELATLSADATAPELEAKLHFLKGAALNLGLTQFAELCQSGENSARQGRLQDIELEAIEAAYRSSVDQFERVTGKTAAA